MIIDERRVEKKGLRVSDTFTPDDNLLLETESFFKKELSYSVSLVRDNEKIKVSGTVKTDVSVKCIRCLDHFTLNINSKFDTILFPLNLVDFSYSALNDDEMEYIFYSNGKIDMPKLIIEQVNLNIPFRTVCSTDCKGICPVCGTNQNYEKCKCDNSLSEINIFNGIKR